MRNSVTDSLSKILSRTLLLVVSAFIFQAIAGAQDIDAEKLLDSLKNQVSQKTGKERVDLLIEISQANWAFDFEESLDYANEVSDQNLIALTHYHIALNKIATGEMDLAMTNIEQSLSIATNLSSKQLLRDNYKLLYQHNKLSGDFETSLEYMKLYTSLKDSLRIQNSENRYKQLQRIFETEKQNNKIDLLQKENRVQELMIIRHNHIKIFLVVLMSTLVLFMAIIVFRFGSVHRTNRLLKQKISELENTNKKLSESSLTLEQLNATKNRFFSIIAHDLKNPFNALLGFSEIISTSFNELEEHEIRDYISIVRTSSRNLYKLLENLLKWSASQTGTMHYLPEKFDLVNLVNAEINFIRINASKKNIDISTDLPDELIIVYDKLLISSVIRNLLDNAVKFTHHGGKIKITARKENQDIYTEIEDTGIGIPEEMKKKLFLLDDSTCRKGTEMEEGGGLGLILCKELIEKSKGKIGVGSREGTGSRFWFRLPLENNNIGYG